MTIELQEEISKLLIRTTQWLSARVKPAYTLQGCANVFTALVPLGPPSMLLCNTTADDTHSEKGTTHYALLNFSQQQPGLQL